MKRTLILVALLAVVLGGCVSQSIRDSDPLVTARQMHAMGFKGRLIIIFGSSHVAGFSWNATGSNGFVEITVDPNVPLNDPDAHPENTIYDADPPGSGGQDPATK